MNENSVLKNPDSKMDFFEKAVRLFPLMFILMVLPLVVRFYPYYTNLSQYGWFTTEDFQVDFFLHGKNVALNVMGVYMLIMLAFYALIGNIEKRKPWILIPVGVYALFAFASSAISPYSAYAFKGNFEGFESVWSVLVYCLIVVYAFYMIRSAKEIKILLYSFSAGIFFLTIIGFFQSIGMNPLDIDWITAMTIPSEYRESLSGIIEFNEGTYLTLYNINYVGVYMAMTVPVMLFLLLDFNKDNCTKNVKSMVIAILKAGTFLVLLAGSLFCLYQSKSEAGILALACGIVFIPIIMYRKLWKHKFITVGCLLVAAVTVVVFGKSYIQPAFQVLINQLSTKSSTHDLSRLHADENGVTFTYKGQDITFRMEEEDEDYWLVRAYDGENNPIAMSGNTWIFALEEEPFSDFYVSYYPVDNYLTLSISLGEETWLFTNQTGSGTYQMLNYYGKWVDLDDPATTAFLEGRELLFSGRGYIWSRSIPLLKQSAVLGVGADSFVFAFPQMDYLGRSYSGYEDNQVFTKPHNLYLQMAIQYGVPAMLAFFVFFGMYFVQSFALYSKEKLDCFEKKAGMGIFIGMCVYMITGLTNDSMIVVSPIFWSLIAIGIVINHIITGEKIENTQEETMS